MKKNTNMQSSSQIDLLNIHVSVLGLVVFLTGVLTTSFPNFSFAGTLDQLSPAALDCYHSVLADDSVFTGTRNFKTDSDLERLVVSMCTYSDAMGAKNCYNQVKSQDDVLAETKNFVNIFGLEQKYARLCSNSKANLKNDHTGDIDAVDCFKSVMNDENVLVYAKKSSMDKVTLEDLVTKMCISSSAKGATECYKNSVNNSEVILNANRQYKNDYGMDLLIVDLCKGSRK